MNSENLKDYQDKDFFLTDEGNSIFEGQSSGPVKHLCITDTAEETVVVSERKTAAGTDQLIEIVVGMGTEIPLWARGSILKWQFDPHFDTYSNAGEVKDYIRRLFSEAVAKWGDAAPVQFEEISDGVWDFEITLLADNCNPYGCTLASAFFPEKSQNTLIVYPKMFSQSYAEQVETLTHEIGHIFGLRHYFAQVKEASWRSEVFGVHHPLTIMNYGPQSTFTATDKADLKKFYSAVWSGQITHLNGLPVQLYTPFSQA